MEYKQVTSKKNKVTLGSGQGSTAIYIATRLTQTTRKNSDGTPIYTKEIIRYPSATSPESGGVVIATGSTEGGASKLSATANITEQEKRNLKNKINGASKTQIDSVKNQLDNSAEAQEALSDLGGSGRNPTSEGADAEGIDLTESLEVREGTKTKEFGEYRYPVNLGSTTQDIVKFDMLKYEARNFETGKDSFEFKDRQKLGQGERQSIGNVILPVPAGIRDDNGVEWGSKTLNPLELAAADLAIGGIKGGAAGFNASLSKTVRKAMGASEDIKEAITGVFAGAATGIGQQLLTRSTGAILNPNMELLFNGPTLRSFTFQYKLSARSQKEADQIINIIRFFKQGMAAQRTKSGIFLNSPNTFQVRYILRGNNDQDHPYIGRMKECALQRFSVNYTPENNYATYEDGYMVSYEINMQFQELEPIYNDDYQSVNGIGY